MKRQAFDDLELAINAHSERRSIDDLAAQGKRHVRVVSKRRVLELIEHIVDQAIQREALEMASNDRDRIVAETRDQFDRAMRARSEQDNKLRDARSAAERLEGDVAELRRTVSRLESDVAIERDAVAALRRANDELVQEHEAELRQRSTQRATMLADAESQLAESERERQRARQVTENALHRAQSDLDKIATLEARLATARATLENYDEEFERMKAQVQDERARQASDESSQIADLESRLAASREMRERLEETVADQERRLDREREDRLELEEHFSEVRTERDAALHESATERAERVAADRRLKEEGEQVSATATEVGRLERLLAEQERSADAESSRWKQALSGSAQELDVAQRDLNASETRVAKSAAAAETSASEAERVGRLLDAAQTRVVDLEGQFSEATERLGDRDREITRLDGEVSTLGVALTQAHAEAATRGNEAAAARATEVDDLRSDLGEMKAMLAGIASRPAGTDEKALGKIIGRLEARDDLRTADFEERFADQLDRTLSEVTREMRLATARPLDFAVEATDVLVARLFDEEHEMSTNLGSLAVEERRDHRDIGGDLARLRKARTGQKIDA